LTLERVITKRNSKGQVVEYEMLHNGKPVPDTHKYCPACNTVKEKTEFTQHGNACKTCANARARTHRLQRRQDPAYIAEFNAKTVSKLQAKKRQAVEYKGNKCFDCGLSFPDCVYDFHHLDPSQKDMNPSALIRLGFEKAKPELDKCVMLCSNCHRIRHFSKE
jgi:hypothetical protein